MIIEPNCSIIAACLPTYGPLFRGGRTAESMIRSVRSVLSLRSRGGSSKGNSTPGSSRGDRTYPGGGFGGASGTPTTTRKAPSSKGGDSQVELRIQQWPGQGPLEVQCVGGQKPSYEMNSLDLQKGAISVTNGVTVERN
jgi:hypothetical protein